MAYASVLLLHSWLRWVVVALGVAVSVRALRGWIGRGGWSKADEWLSRLFVIGLDLQVLVGLGLYLFLSPITTHAFQAAGGVMQNAVVRFWVIEHPFAMLLAVVAAHLGRVRLRRASEAARRHRLAAIFLGTALVLVLAGMPWPFSPAARPLWRGW